MFKSFELKVIVLQNKQFKTSFEAALNLPKIKNGMTINNHSTYTLTSFITENYNGICINPIKMYVDINTRKWFLEMIATEA